MAIKLVD